MLELCIDSYSEGLEYPLGRILVIARSSDDLEEIIGRIDGLDFASFDYCSGYMD
jgi:hypothetical protein